MSGPLDQKIEALEARAAGLATQSLSLLFAYLAERIFSLYEEFERQSGWGNRASLRQHLDTVWDSLAAGVSSPSPTALAEIAAAAPDGDRFDSPGSTYAEDVVICVDAAMRGVLGEKVSIDWLHYAIEPTQILVCFEQTGYTSLGSQETAAVQAQFLTDPRLAAFLSDCDDVVAQISTPVTPSMVADLAVQARSSRLDAAMYFKVHESS